MPSIPFPSPSLENDPRQSSHSRTCRLLSTSLVFLSCQPGNSVWPRASTRRLSPRPSARTLAAPYSRRYTSKVGRFQRRAADRAPRRRVVPVAPSDGRCAECLSDPVAAPQCKAGPPEERRVLPGPRLPPGFAPEAEHQREQARGQPPEFLRRDGHPSAVHRGAIAASPGRSRRFRTLLGRRPEAPRRIAGLPVALCVRARQ